MSTPDRQENAGWTALFTHTYTQMERVTSPRYATSLFVECNRGGFCFAFGIDIGFSDNLTILFILFDLRLFPFLVEVLIFSYSSLCHVFLLILLHAVQFYLHLIVVTLYFVQLCVLRTLAQPVGLMFSAFGKSFLRMSSHTHGSNDSQVCKTTNTYE